MLCNVTISIQFQLQIFVPTGMLWLITVLKRRGQHLTKKTGSVRMITKQATQYQILLGFVNTDTGTTVNSEALAISELWFGNEWEGILLELLCSSSIV